MKGTRPTFVLGTGASNRESVKGAEDIECLATSARSLGLYRIRTTPGYSERSLGLTPTAKKGFAIDAQVECTGHGRCALTRGQVWESVKGSLQRLDVEQVDVLYIGAPDSEALLELQAAAVDDLYRQGKFKRVSSFSIPQPASTLTNSSPARRHKLLPSDTPGLPLRLPAKRLHRPLHLSRHLQPPLALPRVQAHPFPPTTRHQRRGCIPAGGGSPDGPLRAGAGRGRLEAGRRAVQDVRQAVFPRRHRGPRRAGQPARNEPCRGEPEMAVLA